MKKVGIITFHNTLNFGAALQCYALKEIIFRLNCNPEIINHYNKKIADSYSMYSAHIWKRSPLGILKSLVYHTLLNTRKLITHKRFKFFMINNLSIATNDSPSKYDTIVFGSDQIWKASITGNDKYYWGENFPNNIKKITYAASAGKIDEAFYENIKLLYNFNAISVRESDLTKILNDFNIKAQIVLDPTLLLTGEEWAKKFCLKTKNHKKYILVYAMQNLQNTIQFAKRLSILTKMKVRIIYPNVTIFNILKKYSSCGPIQFLKLIYNAEYVITDSFHGTAFSIIFHKNFYTICQGLGFDNRAASLLTQIGLQSRLVTLDHNIFNADPVSYSEADILLNVLRNKSIKFLKSNL